MSTWLRAREMRRSVFIAGLALLFAALSIALAGCSTGSSAESGSSETDEAAEQPKTEVVILSHGRQASALQELAQLYGSEHDDLSLTVQAATSEKNLRKTLATNYRAAQAAQKDSDNESASSAEDVQTVAAVVGMTSSDRAKAEEAKRLSADTDTDLVQDSLVIITKNQKSLTLRDLTAGTYRLCMAAEDSALGDLQQQVLKDAGALNVNGRYVGALSAKGQVKTYSSTAKLFSAVSDSGKNAAIVLRSDVYRYGGVKISGEVAADTYAAPVYSYALTAYASDEQTDAAKDFFNWSVTDADALRIWKKWGFDEAA